MDKDSLFKKQDKDPLYKEICFACGFPKDYGVFADKPKFIRLRIELSTDEPYKNGFVNEEDDLGDFYSPKYTGPKAIALYACPDCGTIQAREK